MVETLQLPPLILHPFSGGTKTSDLVDGSQAALALQGLVDLDIDNPELVRRMVTGRYQELRMLIFLGKDLRRWSQQCVDHYQREEGHDKRINEQSFSELVVESPPEPVKDKLVKWGVTDRKSIFARAIGLHSIFEDPPPVENFTLSYLENYHRYADYAYICHQHLRPFLTLKPADHWFEIYASEEYARKLSEEWERV